MRRRLIFVHGWATDPWVFDSTAEGLSGGNGCERVRLPGHGGEGRWAEPSIAPAVYAVEEAVSKGPGDEGVVGIGWSLGAQALLKAASRKPGAFAALVLIGATPRFVQTDDFPHGQPRALVKRMIMDMKKDPASTVGRFYALNFTEEELATDAARAFLERYRYPGPVECTDEEGAPPACRPAFDYAGVTTALEALYLTDLRGELAGIKAPALAVHGERDGVCPMEAGDYLAGHIGGAELKVIKDAGHAPFLTAPEEFTAIVKGFIKGL